MFLLLLSLAWADEPPKIVNGTPAADGAWPDAVALYRDDSFHCSGVLVDPEWVLTAGHCSDVIHMARIGSISSEEGGELISVVETREFPDYREAYDVQLLRLAQPSSQPVSTLGIDCIADNLIRQDQPVTIVGFGATNVGGGAVSEILRQAEVPIVDPLCLTPDKDCQPAVAPHGEFIAGGDGTDTCDGDSGGPVYALLDETVVLVGVTSRAVRPSKTDCGEGGIYTQLDAIVPWMREQTGRLFLPPNCDALGLNRRPRPGPERLVVHAGKTTRGRLDPHDDDDVVFSVLEPPTVGTLSLKDNGRYRFDNEVDLSQPDAPSSDVFLVQVDDAGSPPLTGMAWITLSVEEPTGLCGPPLRGGPLCWWILSLGALLGTKRRTSA